jgi:hypothetical protein
MRRGPEQAHTVRLAFDAPDQVCILRAELLGRQDRPVPDPDLEGKR